MYNGSLFLSLVQRQEEAQVGFCFSFESLELKKGKGECDDKLISYF